MLCGKKYHTEKTPVFMGVFVILGVIFKNAVFER
jgi:hypothetical protein